MGCSEEPRGKSVANGKDFLPPTRAGVDDPPPAQISPRVRPYRRRVAPRSGLEMVLSKALRAATRGVSTSAGARMALPALTAAVPKPSMMSAIFGGSAGPAMPPMDQPVPGLAVPDPPAAPAAAPVTNITTLSNGAKIASEDTPVRFTPETPRRRLEALPSLAREIEPAKPQARARWARRAAVFPVAERPRTRRDADVGPRRAHRPRRTRNREPTARDQPPSLASPTPPSSRATNTPRAAETARREGPKIHTKPPPLVNRHRPRARASHPHLSH